MATTPEINEPATSRQLMRGTVLALVVAAILLVAVILPAEYGKDPTGIGKGLGLYRPAQAAVAPAPPQAVPDATTPVAAGNSTLFKSDAPFRSDEMTVVLKSGEGAEVKALMQQGQKLVFTWTAEGGALEVDMHGERVGAKEGEFTSYWKTVEQSSGHGAFEAPFAGTHGWFWENVGFETVTVKVKTSGFYEKVYRP